MRVVRPVGLDTLAMGELCLPMRVVGLPRLCRRGGAVRVVAASMAKPRSPAPLYGSVREALGKQRAPGCREGGGLAPRRTDSCAASPGLVCDGS